MKPSVDSSGRLLFGPRTAAFSACAGCLRFCRRDIFNAVALTLSPSTEEGACELLKHSDYKSGNMEDKPADPLQTSWRCLYSARRGTWSWSWQQGTNKEGIKLSAGTLRTKRCLWNTCNRQHWNLQKTQALYDDNLEHTRKQKKMKFIKKEK